MNQERTSSRLRSRIGLLAVVALLLVSTTAQSQYRQWVDTTLPAMVKPYGVGSSEMLIGAYKYYYNNNRPVTELWDFYSSLGINTVLLCASDFYRSQFDSFLLATNRPQNGRVIVADAWKVIQATSAREIEFYPFDSSQSRKWGYNECVALSYDDDNLQRNINYDHRPLEAVYDIADTGTLALGDIAYNYRPEHVHRFQQVETDTGWRAIPNDSIINRYQLSLDTIGKTYYITLTGHLFSTGEADDTSRMFRIEIWNEINKGRQYFPAGDSVMRAATDNLSLLYHTLYVRKSDLLPAGPPPLNWNQYRTVSLPIDLHGDTGRMSGPLRQDQETSRRFNIKVYYEGGEKVALRSVAVRDSIAEMMIGTRTESQDYRDRLLDSLTAMLRNSDGSLRTQIMAIYGKDEPRYEYFAGARELNKMLRANFSVGTDSLSTETALAVPHHQDLGTSNTLWWETYVNEPFDKATGWDGINLAERFGVDLDSQPPALKEHNGGRFTIPEMFSLANVLTTSYTTLQQKIESFNEMYNQMYWGRYTPYEPSWPYKNRIAYELGTSARLARERGKRLFILPGIVRSFDIKAIGDTVASRQQEPSELRMMLGLNLCYGATGLLYYVTHSSANFLNDQHLGAHCCWEIPGSTTGDTLVDIGDISISNVAETFQDVIPGLYVGYRNRTRELRQMNAWIARVGGTLASLRWRDGYSVNFQVRRPNKDAGYTPRPLPNNEIITEVTSRPRWDTVKDAPHATYVELGFFDTKRGKTSGQLDPQKDTNYVFVTNRRTFETPSTVTLSTGQKQRLDSLSESRVISLKWNLQSGGDQFLFVRIQEIAPDTVIYLPGDSGPRRGLDTIIPASGGVSQLVLRPGGSALLRATFMPPAEAITGNLDYNNQHKMAYYKPPTSSWGRYYATYYKDTSLYNPDIPDSLNPYRTTWTFLRRSLPVDTTGVIRWEPMEYPLAIAAGSTRIQNLHPALTLTPMGNNVVATVVWTCHSTTASDTLHREVVLRNVAFGNSSAAGSMAWIEHVEDYAKNNLNNPSLLLPWTRWGTPVIARLDSGFAILYSDAWAGIMATIRKRPAGSSWWLMPGVYASATQVSAIYTGPRLDYGLFPTVPSFAHAGNHDSTIGFAWVQPIRQSNGGRQEILYGRLAQGRDPLNPTLPSVEVSSQTLRRITFGDERDYFPSMDQTQDPYGRIQEVVTWESPSFLDYAFWRRPWWPQKVFIRSIWVEPTPGSVFGYPWLWGARQVIAATSMDHGGTPVYATIASLNDLSGVAFPDNYNAFFSIAWTDNNGEMSQGKFRYTEDFYEGRIRSYLFGGVFPQASTSEQRQVGRQGVLYQAGSDGTNPVMQTTREFFARSAPTDYTAQGREISFAVDTLDDSSSCRVRGVMFNPWFANNQTSMSLKLVARDSTYRRIDSLPQARTLFRTVNFHSYDSTRISLSVGGAFVGADTTGKRLTVVTELIDSASNSMVYQLDSFSVSSVSALRQRIIDTTFDLLSGSYYIRLRVDTANVQVPTIAYDSRYMVVEISGAIDGDGLGKVRREGAITSNHARISAQPNPFTGTTELRFSIPSAGDVAIRVFDPIGRPVAEVLPGQWMDVGRYTIGFDASQLPPGTYVVELMLGQQRVVEKVVVR